MGPFKARDLVHASYQKGCGIQRMHMELLFVASVARPADLAHHLSFTLRPCACRRME